MAVMLENARPASRPVLKGLFCLLGLICLLSIWGFIQSFVYSYADGNKGNNYSAVWVTGFTFVLCIQAAAVMVNPQLTNKRPARFYAWTWYSCWMFTAGLIILIGLGIALPEQSGWAIFWVVISPIILAAAVLHRKHSSSSALPATLAAIQVATEDPSQAPTSNKSTANAVTSAKAPCCSGQAWRNCCTGFANCLGWSSLFWLSVLGFFLALQAAWLAADKTAYPPPGTLVTVPIDTASGNTVPAKLHIYCSGPATPGLSTLILEGGGGSPGVALAGLADLLAAGGRRVCYYDRLGYGWSDDAIKPTTTRRSVNALHALLTSTLSPDAPAPYILIGHSVGGQIALHFAALYPNLVSGITMVDSYSDVAIDLNMKLDAAAVAEGLKLRPIQAPNGTTVQLPDTTSFYASVGPILDVLRAVTPLGWGRFITNGDKTGPEGKRVAAMYGNNKEWHVQWVEVLGMSTPPSLDDDLTILSGRQVWHGTGWPDLGSKPVLLLPAEKTLQLPNNCSSPPGKLASDVTCQSSVTDAATWCSSSEEGKSRGSKCVPDLVYADLYLSYLATLSNNATLAVMPGNHGFPMDTPEQASQEILAKFAGV